MSKLDELDNGNNKSKPKGGLKVVNFSAEEDNDIKIYQDKKAESSNKKSTQEDDDRSLIYLDTDDDITAIISKVKANNSKDIALAPPKRFGALQSVVNLKLLLRVARNGRKKISLVTTDKALINLAAGLGIPVAKNINSSPVVPNIKVDDDVSDVIDGSDLSIGELDEAYSEADKAKDDKSMSAVVDAIETEDKINNDLNANGINDDEEDGSKNNNKKAKRAKGRGIPDFASFRKKLLIGLALLLLLGGGSVWAFIFAPHANILIKSKTTALDTKGSLNLIPSGDANFDTGTLVADIKQKKLNESANFEASGTKEIGERAKGVVTIYYYQLRYSPDGTHNIITINAGTRLYANGMQYTTDGPVTVEGCYTDINDYTRGRSEKCGSGVSVRATATNVGPEYNIAPNTSLAVSGHDQGTVVASVRDSFSGGKKETVKVVKQSDIDAAVEKIKNNLDSEKIKKELTSQVNDSDIIIDDSFSVNYGAVKASPNVDETPNGSGSVSVEVTYTLVSVSKKDLSKVLKSNVKAKPEAADQKVYDDGLKSIKFSGFSQVARGYTVNFQTTSHIGAKIDENQLKKQVIGKKSEEIKAGVSKLAGVTDVDVVMVPFWVNSVSSADKVNIKFTVDE